MVAGLFAAHGVWYGETRPILPGNPKGNFEGTAIGDVLDRHYPPLASIGLEGNSVPGIAYEIVHALQRTDYCGGPWLWKGSAMYWRAFVDLDPHWITVRRDEAAILLSNRKNRRIGGNAEYAVAAHRMMLDYLEAAGAARIDSECVVNGEYRQVKKAFERCGIEFNEEIARSWVEPSLWHFTTSPTTTTSTTSAAR